MTTLQNPSLVMRGEEIEETKVKKVSKFLWFKTEWWETVSTKHLGNDIRIETEHPIRNVYLNGKLIKHHD